MKLIELINAQQALNRMANVRMPAKLAYAIVKNQRLIEPEIETYNKTRIKILEANGKPNRETGNYDIDPDKVEAVEKEVEELVKTEVEIKPYLIDLNLFGDVLVALADLRAIEWMIVEDGKVTEEK